MAYSPTYYSYPSRQTNNSHRHQLHITKCKKRRKKSNGCCCLSEGGNNNKNKSRGICTNAIVGLSLFFITVIVITIALIAIYMGMEMVFDGSIRITSGDTFSNDLYNKTSHNFITKSHLYKNMMESVFSRSVIRAAVKQCSILGFRNGSLIVFFRIILNRQKVPSRMLSNLEESLVSIIMDEVTSSRPAVFHSIVVDPAQIHINQHPNTVNPLQPKGIDTFSSQISNTDLPPPKNTLITSARRNFSNNLQLTSSKRKKPDTLQKQVSSSTASTVSKAGSVTLEKVTANNKPQTNKGHGIFHADLNVNDGKFRNKDKRKGHISRAPPPNNNKRYSFISEEIKLLTNNRAGAGVGEVEVVTDEQNIKTSEKMMIKPIIERVEKIHREENKAFIENIKKIIKNSTTVTPPPPQVKNEPTNLLPAKSNIAFKSKPNHNNDNNLLNDENDESTENSMIILNTEVVTSTSMQISYGQKGKDTVDSDVKNISKDSTKSTEAPIKYKNISPRKMSFDFVNHNVKKRSINLDDSSQLTFMIEKYKNNPTNETLYLIINELASLYTKTTTSSSSSYYKKDEGPFITQKTWSQKLLNRRNFTTTTSKPKDKGCELSSASTLCDNGDCIPVDSWCNQLTDCSDGSDERNCTCADYMKAQSSSKKICDGIVDCWDFSDENICDWCSPDQYVCWNSKMCIDKKKLCNGIRECPQGDDERNCIAVAPDINRANDINYHSTGYVMVRRSGQWGKLCPYNKHDGQLSDTSNHLSELGKAVCRSMTFKNFVQIKIARESDVEDNPIYYRLTDISKNNTKFVRRKNFKFVKSQCENKQVVQVSCNNLECGVQTQTTGRVKIQGRGERHSRIVGGGSAAPGAWPWQAALYKEGEFQCGATLISDRWLMSAGHCFYNALESYWVARLGVLRRGSTLPSPYEQLRQIYRIVLHPNYVDAGFINDISLLQTKQPVQFSSFVRPICLPSPTSLLLDGTLCTVIGWGQLLESGRVFPDTLQEVELPVISTMECRKRTLFLPIYKVTDNMLCAGYERGGRDACLGDSGGPLMCQDGSDDAWYLHGVTSNGYGCARAHRPGVYTKVANYINWIDEITNNDKMNSSKPSQSFCSGHRCPLGECLSRSRICNGYMECSDGSDEINC